MPKPSQYEIQPAALADYLSHILDAIDRIGRYTANRDKASFLNDEMAQDAVIRNIEIIGEASHNIEREYPEFATAHPELPLAFAYQMRNAVAHGYFQVDLEIVWRTVQSDFHGLHRQIQAALSQLPKGRPDGS